MDEFPHTNVPGSERAKRWEDVEKLLDAGIDVLTTMNIQHLESLNDQVLQISGIKVRETIPDWVVQQADEVVMVDLTPRALLHRLQRGVGYRPEKAESALRNFFREPTPGRSPGTCVTAGRSRSETPDEPGRDWPGCSSEHGNTETQKHHRMLVLVTADPRTAMLIRRAKRMSDLSALNASPLRFSRPEI